MGLIAWAGGTLPYLGGMIWGTLTALGILKNARGDDETPAS